MSPSKKVICTSDPRPAPLKVHRDSYLINKPAGGLHPSSSSFSSSSSLSDSDGSNDGITTAAANNHPPPRRQPVIIYTHSPKIIHTQPCDFMALVQKLTGLSRSEDGAAAAAATPPPPSDARINSRSYVNSAAPRTAAYTSSDNSSSLSSVTSGITSDVQPPPPPPPPPLPTDASPPVFDPPLLNPLLSDISLFYPDPSDLLCSPRRYYSYPNAVFSSPNVGNSVGDAMTTLHEY